MRANNSWFYHTMEELMRSKWDTKARRYYATGIPSWRAYQLTVDLHRETYHKVKSIDVYERKLNARKLNQKHHVDPDEFIEMLWAHSAEHSTVPDIVDFQQSVYRCIEKIRSTPKYGDEYMIILGVMLYRYGLQEFLDDWQQSFFAKNKVSTGVIRGDRALISLLGYTSQVSRGGSYASSTLRKRTGQLRSIVSDIINR